VNKTYATIGIALVSFLILSLVSCATGVQRVSPDRQIDLSGAWNDSDSRAVAAAMSDDFLAGRWMGNFAAENSGRPAIVVGSVLNRTHEHIATNTFVTDIERTLINAGTVRVLQGGDFREQLRAERTDQQQLASPESAARLGREIGANFVLQGSISSIVDSSGRQQLVFYQVDLQLTSVETAEKVWIGTHQIKKLVSR
jgi:penicillin-binding protein activator